MTLGDYLLLLRRGWLLVLATTLVGLALAYAATAAVVPTYTSSATIVVSPAAGSGTDLAGASTFAEQRAASYAGLATTDYVLTPAASAIGETAGQLRGVVSAAVQDGTGLVEVTATADAAQEAARRTDAVADALVSRAAAVDSTGAGSGVQLTVVTRAQTPTAPTSPRPANNLAIGGVIGLALGVALVIVAQSLSTRLWTTADLPRDDRIATTTSLPVRRGGPLRSDRADFRLEAFRHLRANLQFSRAAGSFLAVAGVTADSDAHGVAAQLAEVMGEIGLRVVVVDAVLRPSGTGRRSSHRTAADAPGVADVLTGVARPADVVQPGSSEGVHVIGAGTVKESSAQLISTAPMGQMLEALDADFDFVVVACPPVVERSESVVLAALCGSSLLVVESGDTRRDELLSALDLLGGVGVGAASVAVDHVSRRRSVVARQEPRAAEAPA